MLVIPEIFDFDNMACRCQQCRKLGPSAQDYDGSRFPEAMRRAYDVGFERRVDRERLDLILLCEVCKHDWPKL